MININGIQADITTSVDSLSSKNAVFIVEFEFDNRLIVCHTLNQPVHKKIKHLINQIMSANIKSIELRQALLNSKYITVSVEKCDFEDEISLFAYKYELIKTNKTYAPYGYNTFTNMNSSLEQSYANILLKELLDEIDRTAIYPYNAKDKSDIPDALCTHKKRGRTPKPVCCYDKNTGLLVKEYESIKSASEDMKIRASNISLCCNGRIKSAGGYVWSYI